MDLEKLKELAEKTPDPYVSNDPLAWAKLNKFQQAANPQTVLSLISELTAAREVISKTKAFRSVAKDWFEQNEYIKPSDELCDVYDPMIKALERYDKTRSGDES